jgi:hypothetical protein
MTMVSSIDSASRGGGLAVVCAAWSCASAVPLDRQAAVSTASAVPLGRFNDVIGFLPRLDCS